MCSVTLRRPGAGREGRHLAGLQDLQDFRLLVRLDAGEIIGLDGVDPDVAALQVQAFHPPGLGLVEIDRAGVAFPQGPVAVHGAQGPLLAHLEDGEAFAHAPDVHFLLGKPVPGEPGVARGGVQQLAFPGQLIDDRLIGLEVEEGLIFDAAGAVPGRRRAGGP